MMNTLQEQEEEEAKPIREESDSSLPPIETKRPRRLSAFRLSDARKMSEPKPDGAKHDKKLEIPQIYETQATPRPHRRSSTLETVLQVFRRPSSATLDAFNNLHRGSNSRRGSHTNSDSSRRPSPGSAEMHNIPPRFHENSSQKGALVPVNQVSFRRPSGIVTFNPDMMNSNQKRYIMGLLKGGNDSNPSLTGIGQEHGSKKKEKIKPCKDGNDALVTILSALYCKLLFIMGIAFPVTEVLSSKVPTHYYQVFYLYLYVGSLLFMSFMYMTLLKNRAISQLLKSSFDVEDDELQRFQKKRWRTASKRLVRYGSFYLRLGAVAFGIGSMVYSGLEFGQYFELKDSHCRNLLQAVTPIARMILTLIQMQFIFLNSRHMEMSRYTGIARFGLMHMIGTNLCEWIFVIVEETKHEIIHIIDHEKEHDTKHHDRHERGTDKHDIFECRRGNVMGSLVQDASPFLFPCTIEYSLICAVIMYEMWKTVKNTEESEEDEKPTLTRQTSKTSSDVDKSNNHFTVDCSNAHKGLFSGILLLVVTIISLIMFVVMNKDPSYQDIAQKEVYIWELIMYVLTTGVVLYGGWKMRFLRYKINRRKEGIGLDNTLLIWAQSGVFIYCMFSAIACYFQLPTFSAGGAIIEALNLIQSVAQTVFILDATFRRTDSPELNRSKPGRQIITLLLVSNMALWLVNTLQKSRAEYRPTHSDFYGKWAWTIITHLSMPLAIFFRFHSTICLFEVWKNAYKFKHEQVTLLGNTVSSHSHS